MLNYVINSTHNYTTKLNREKILSINKRKLLRDSKNWCRAEKVKKCLINKTWLIEYNPVRSYVRLIDEFQLINNGREIDL